jgi:hypothetical protein
VPDTSTVDIDRPESAVGQRRMRHRQWMSWFTALVLAAVIGSAVVDGLDLVDVWGVDDDTVSVTGADGTTLTVKHPTVVRPALAAPFEIVVERPGGFDGPIELSIDLAYLQLWDLNGLFPAPSAERSAGDAIVWEFDPPDGEVLRVVYEARIEPAVQLETQRATVSLLDPSDVLRVHISTRVRP